MVGSGVAIGNRLNRLDGEYMTFGILTLATPGDYRKAIGLALSARVCNPGVPLAVACSPKLRPLLAPFFDHVVDENPALKGFEHKVHLDRYSPFEDTFFFDSDVLLFKDLREIVERWSDQPYTASGDYMVDGFSSFGLDRRKVLKKIGKPQLAVIDGAGHAFFRKPGCIAVFDLAREITARHCEYAGNIQYADEDVIDIAMTMLDLAPAPGHDFFSRHMTATPGTLHMDASLGECNFIAKHSGQLMAPFMMHFAANEAPFPYARQLRKLFKKNGVSTEGILRIACHDYFDFEIKPKVKKLVMWAKALFQA
jgi:hypothetical protein